MCLGEYGGTVGVVSWVPMVHVCIQMHKHVLVVWCGSVIMHEVCCILLCGVLCSATCDL